MNSILGRMALLVSEEFIQSEQKSVAQSVEAENGIRGLGGATLYLESECSCAAGMEFLVEQRHLAIDAVPGFERRGFRGQPGAEAALCGIDGRRHAPFAVEECLDGADPGDVFRGSIQQGPVSWLKNSHVRPLSLRGPGGYPAG